MTYWVIGIIGFIMLIGFITIARKKVEWTSAGEFVNNYRNVFIQFSNAYFERHNSILGTSKGFDNEKYEWLTKNVNKVQRYLGHHGIIGYRAAFGLFYTSRYEVIINSLPKYRDGNVQAFDVNTVDDCLTRYLGSVEDYLEKEHKNLKNPVIWFKEGVQAVLSLLIYIPNWLGLIPDKAVPMIVTSFFFKFIAGVVGATAFLSGLIAIFESKGFMEFCDVIFK